jgi:hypothetical protein
MSETEGKKFGWFIAKPDGKTDIARSAKDFSAENWAEFEGKLRSRQSFGHS